MSGAGVRRQIASAIELQSVVRTMKALAASSIGQYERSMRALGDYDRAVQLGLGECLRCIGPLQPAGAGSGPQARPVLHAVVFGSDQGLVGRFNETVVAHAITALAAVPGRVRIWAVGERVRARLADAGHVPERGYAVPTTIQGVAPLIGQILIDSQAQGRHDASGALHLFFNSPLAGAGYATLEQRLLPLDEGWRRERAGLRWPTQPLPEVIGGAADTLAALIGEHLFVSLFKACAASLASENASRLAAMQRAEKNIDERLDELRGRYYRQRQTAIDEELFEVIAGFEALLPG